MKKPPDKRNHLRGKIKIVKDPSRIEPTEVAALLGKSYQRARNLMLAGKLGEPHYDNDTRKLTVNREQVLAYRKAHRNDRDDPKLT